ncbi:MAG: hypothetical protein AAGC74_07950 [Verrucomicrobiota bacterium]
MKLFLTFLLLSSSLFSFDWTQHYAIEDLEIPANIDPQVGGLDLNSKGQLVACFHRGEVLIYDEPSNHWSLFATGLQEPLGLQVAKDDSVIVIQRAELTRLVDEDGDGRADLYQTLCDDWGMTGNYHEFTFGLAEDSQGRYYIGLGTASNNGGARPEMRGDWNETGGLTHDRFKVVRGDSTPWKERKKGTPRMYARVPYRGCILRITPGNRKAELYATGFRTPNGLFVDAQDQLWVADNQGDWLGSSKLHRVQQNQFHGHPASLLWDKNPPQTIPANLPPSELDARRIKSAAFLPQGDCSNSPTEMRAIPANGTFAPVALDTQLLIGEMNHAKLIRYLPDHVNSQHQGTAVHFLNTEQLGIGNNRMAFSADKKTLYLGKTKLSWAGFRGIKKITYQDKPFLTASQVKLTPNGFQFTFSSPPEPLPKDEPLFIESYHLAYNAKYGSPKHDLTVQPVKSASLTGNTLTITLENPPLADRVYDIRLPQLTSSQLGPLDSTRYFYTAHQVHE